MAEMYDIEFNAFNNIYVLAPFSGITLGYPTD